jgi:hypothetical protein
VTAGRRILLIGGIALAVVGMCHGTWYAVFAEHQALDRIGGSVANSFAQAAERNPGQVTASLSNYREAKYVYERQVDAHGHWIGLAMLLVVLGIGFDRVGFSERWKSLLALAMLAGAVLFPLSVLFQALDHGSVPRALSVASSGLMIAAMAAAACGFALNRPRA